MGPRQASFAAFVEVLDEAGDQFETRVAALDRSTPDPDEHGSEHPLAQPIQ